MANKNVYGLEVCSCRLTANSIFFAAFDRLFQSKKMHVNPFLMVPDSSQYSIFGLIQILAQCGGRSVFCNPGQQDQRNSTR